MLKIIKVKNETTHLCKNSTNILRKENKNNFLMIKKLTFT